MPARNGGESPWLNKPGLDSSFFAEKYHDLKLTQKLSAGNTVYHIMNVVVPNGYIASALYNLAMAATADQSHVYQLVSTICQLTDTNNILGDQLK